MNTASIDNTKRRLLQFAALSPLVTSSGVSRAAESRLRIAFGSCLHQDKEQGIWNAVLADRPDLFVFLGDNIYGDSDDPAVLREKYRKLAAKPGFQKLRQQTTVVATWDDHDYGRNDAGVEYPFKEASRELMLSFWNEPAESDRRTRDDGIYTSYMIEGPARSTIQIILLDLRWNRTPVPTVGTGEELEKRDAANMGPYRPVSDGNATLLGEKQWLWLEEQLGEKADVRILGSSIQVLADFTGWESWLNFPLERERLLGLLGKYQQTPVVLISGDVHWCELSRLEHPALQVPIFELTSSGLTETWEAISPNRNRISGAYAVPNYGLIDLERPDPAGPLNINLAIRNETGEELIRYAL